MRHDPIRLADTRAWLVKALQDLTAGERDLSGDPPLCGDVMFHAQQAAEKALKGFLTWYDIPFRKTHDLRELTDACLAVDSFLETLRDKSEGLTPYAWRFRYPGEPEEPGREEAAEALAIARELYEAIIARLPEKVRP